MNSWTSFAKRCGWSLCGKWPAFGITSTRASGASRAACEAWETGMTWSSLPQITAIGITCVR